MIAALAYQVWLGILTDLHKTHCWASTCLALDRLAQVDDIAADMMPDMIKRAHLSRVILDVQA